MGYFLACIIILIWSFWFVVSRLGVSGVLGPIDIIFVRYCTAMLIALPFIRHLPLKRLGFVRSFLIGGCFGGVYNIFAFYGLALFQSNHGAVLIAGCVPIFGTIFALMSRRIVSMGKYIAVGLIMISIVLFMSNNQYTFSTYIKVWGIGMLLIASFFYSFGIWLLEKYTLQPKELLTTTTLFSFVLAIPLYIIWGDFSLIREEPVQLLIQAGYQGVLVSSVALFLISITVRLIGSLVFSFFIACIPVLTTIFAFLMKEPVSYIDGIASVICTIGIVVSHLPIQKKQSKYLRQA